MSSVYYNQEKSAMESPDPFANLEGQQYMSLVTFRPSGEPVPTPVWFAREGDVLYVTTLKRSGKVKRLRETGAFGLWGEQV
jgi:hypothetical protein